MVVSTFRDFGSALYHITRYFISYSWLTHDNGDGLSESGQTSGTGFRLHPCCFTAPSTVTRWNHYLMNWFDLLGIKYLYGVSGNIHSYLQRPLSRLHPCCSPAPSTITPVKSSSSELAWSIRAQYFHGGTICIERCIERYKKRPLSYHQTNH